MGLETYGVADVTITSSAVSVQASALVALPADAASPIRVVRLADAMIDLNGPAPGIVMLDHERMLDLETGRERALLRAALSPDGTRLAGIAGADATVVDRATFDTIESARPTHVDDAQARWAPDGSFVVYSGGADIFVLAGGRITIEKPSPGVTLDSTMVKAPDGWRVAFRAYDPAAERQEPHVVLFDPTKGTERSGTLWSRSARIDRLFSTPSRRQLYAIVTDYSPETLLTNERYFTPALYAVDVVTGKLTPLARGARREGYGVSDGGLTAGNVTCHQISWGETMSSCEAHAFFNMSSRSAVAPGTRCILQGEVAYDLIDPARAPGREVPASMDRPLTGQDACNQALSPDARLFAHLEDEPDGEARPMHLVVSERTSGKVIRDIAISRDALRRGRRDQDLQLRLAFDKDSKGVTVRERGDPVHVDLERGAVEVRRLETALEVDDALIESYLSSVGATRAKPMRLGPSPRR
jgi:hypothetical protein